MTPVLFLDFDGVLNSFELFESKQLNYGHGKPQLERGLCMLDRELAARVQHICAATGASIVISSAWRITYPLPMLGVILQRLGVTAPVIGRTGVYDSRGDEIRMWLAGNPGFGPCAALDDMADMGSMQDRLVNTNPRVGITDADAERAIALLQEQP